MASTYSTILRLTYPTTGDLAGTWGTIVNTGVTALVEDALAGVASIAMADANYTLSANNGVSDEARKAFLQITGALTASRDIIIPAVTKAYTVTNATTGGFSVVVKPAAGTGVTIPNGSTYMVRCDGTNVVAMFTGFPYTGTQDFSGATLVTLPANTTIGNVSAAELAYLDGVTSAIQTQLNAKAPIASPTFTGTVTIPAGASIDGFAPLASPTFTGTVTIPAGASIDGFAPLASPALTGTPTAPTATAGTSTTQLATTAFAYNNFAPVASPAFTGTPTAPTASPGTSTTQLATTAFAAGLAFSAALPNQTGNSGKLVTTDGSSASWTAVKTVNNASILTTGNIDIVGTGGTTSTASITLTASSAAAMSVTPATPGLYVTLPDATTCTKADNLYAVYNAGDYDYGVKDSAGTQLGWIRARTGAMIGLADNSTAAGVWAYYGLEKTGITASYVNSTLTNMGSTIRRIALDANRTCFLFGGVDCYAIVYDASTQTWGSATLVRATIGSGDFAGVLSATNQVLVFTCDTSTAGQAVTLTISGTGVTVNTPVAKTMPATISAVGLLIAVGSSFVFAFGTSSAQYVMALTVSGTVPSAGSETTVLGDANVAPNIFASGSVVRTVSIVGASSMYCKPFTVSGATLSAGTQAAAAATGSSFRAFLNGNGNIVCHYINTTHYATIFKLTGTVEAASSVSLGTATTSITVHNDYGVISASKTLFTGIVSGATWYANILTDTAGTASAGSQLSGSMQGNVTPGIPVFNVSGNTAYVAAVTTTQSSVLTIDCSGASPTLTSAVTIIGGSTNTASSYPKSSDIYGVRNPWMIRAGSSLIAIANYSVDNSSFFSNGVRYTPSSVIREKPLPIAGQFGYFYGVTVSNTESYLNVPFNNGSTGQVIQRIEAAA